jgi:outer membrane lipoprotein-sorting protein
MNSNCENIKDQIADLVTGILSEDQMQKLQQHLDECADCRDYAHALKDEDMSLTELFEKIETDMISRQEQVLQEIDRSCISRRTFALSIRRTIMKNPITKLAAAALIIISILIAVSYFRGPINVTSPVFANVMEQIQKAWSVTYQETYYPGESREFTNTEMIIESGIKRSELTHGNIIIFDLNAGKTLHLIQDINKAILTQRVGRSRGKSLFNYLNWVSSLHEDNGVFTGQQKLDGKMTDVFVVEMPFEKTTVWVDPETDLPVRVEMVSWPNPNTDIIVPQMSLSIRDFGGEANEARSIIIGSGRGSPEGIQKEMTRILSDFSWNIELDESLFSLEPPEGYTLEERQFDVSETGENGLVQALAFWTEMSDGMFPAKINDLGDPNMVRPMLIEKFDKDGDPAEELDQAMKQAHIILKGLFFAQKCKAQGSWNYAGEGVILADEDTPVCWWKSENSEDYRIIYADLSIGNIPIEDLTEPP